MCKNDSQCPRGQSCVRGVCTATARRPPMRWLWSLLCLTLVAAADPQTERQADFAKNSRAAICADECEIQSASAAQAETRCNVSRGECKASCEEVVSVCKARHDTTLQLDNDACESSPSYAAMPDEEINKAVIRCKTQALARHGARCAACDGQAMACGSVECSQSDSMCKEARKSRDQATAKCGECGK